MWWSERSYKTLNVDDFSSNQDMKYIQLNVISPPAHLYDKAEVSKLKKVFQEQ